MNRYILHVEEKMSRHLDDTNEYNGLRRGEPGRLAEAFEDCNAEKERNRRRQKLALLWKHRIGGVPTVAWVLLCAAALLSLNLGFGRPWF